MITFYLICFLVRGNILLEVIWSERLTKDEREVFKKNCNYSSKEKTLLIF